MKTGVKISVTINDDIKNNQKRMRRGLKNSRLKFKWVLKI